VLVTVKSIAHSVQFCPKTSLRTDFCIYRDFDGTSSTRHLDRDFHSQTNRISWN
jgi:hypothetical protein